jgi:hypothetical protein
MKIPLVMAMSLAVLVVSGCVDREAEARRAKAEAEAKARADAALKEMDTMPQAFTSPPFFKLNEPAKKTEPAAEEQKPKSKP